MYCKQYCDILYTVIEYTVLVLYCSTTYFTCFVLCCNTNYLDNTVLYNLLNYSVLLCNVIFIYILVKCIVNSRYTVLIDCNRIYRTCIYCSTPYFTCFVLCCNTNYLDNTVLYNLLNYSVLLCNVIFIYIQLNVL